MKLLLIYLLLGFVAVYLVGGFDAVLALATLLVIAEVYWILT